MNPLSPLRPTGSTWGEFWRAAALVAALMIVAIVYGILRPGSLPALPKSWPWKKPAAACSSADVRRIEGLEQPSLRAREGKGRVDVAKGKGSRVLMVGWDSSRGIKDAAAWISSDCGRHFKRVSTPAFKAQTAQSMNAVAAWHDEFVVVGAVERLGHSDTPRYKAAVWSSAGKRRTWTVRTIGGGDDVVMNDVVTFNGRLTAVGTIAHRSDSGRLWYDAAVWTSADGVTWRRVPDPQDVLGGSGDQFMKSIHVEGGRLVARGGSGSGDDLAEAAWTSSDSRTWKRVPA